MLLAIPEYTRIPFVRPLSQFNGLGSGNYEHHGSQVWTFWRGASTGLLHMDSPDYEAEGCVDGIGLPALVRPRLLFVSGEAADNH